MSDLQIVTRSTASLTPNGSNARTHSRRQIRQIATSIESFGFNNPVLIDARNTVIAGHGRLEAARLLGMAHVPTLQLEHLTDAQKRAYIIADNRLAELGGWDKEILAIELQNLLEVDTEFELTATGFETAEIDLLLSDSCRSEVLSDPDDQVALVAPGPAVSKKASLWLIGPHRLYCGDALSGESYINLMGEERAQMVFTDPPYNVPIDGHVCGLGKAHHANFAMASGEMSEGEFTRFLTRAFRHMAAVSIDGSIHFICMDWRHLLELLRAGRIAYSELKNLCVWTKENGGMGSLYRSQHEFVAVFKKGEAPHVNNVELGKYGRYRTNVWSYPGLNGFQSGRDEQLAMHPTVKPVAMVADAILDCSTRHGIILDPFAGSGTTIIAAQSSGRRCFAMELEPAYADVALRRVRSATRLEPICALTGAKFTEMELCALEAPTNKSENPCTEPAMETRCGSIK